MKIPNYRNEIQTKARICFVKQMARFETDPDPIVKCVQHILNKLFSVTEKDQREQIRILDYTFTGLAVMATYQSKTMSSNEKFKTPRNTMISVYHLSLY
jgi:hypothetical protein